MSSQLSDLRVLSRAGAVPLTAEAVRGPVPLRAGTAVPTPRKRRAAAVLVGSVVVLAVALLAYAWRDALLPAIDVRVVPVLLRAGIADGPHKDGQGGYTVQAPGWVEPEPYAVSVAALTDGVVREVLVLEGQAVKKGDVVARMVDDDARNSLARAEASVSARAGELKQAEAQRTAAKADWEHPVERTRAVAAGEALLAESRAALARQASDIAVEAARVAELADEAMRKERSVAMDAATESELVQTRLKLEAQRAMLASAKANEPVLAAKVRQQEADLAAARENAKLRITERRALDESEAAVARAGAALAEARVARDEAKLRLDRMAIRAPSDGVVMARHIEPGSTMMLNTDSPASAHAARLYDPAKLQVRVDIPLADAAKVCVGRRAKVVVGVLPDRTFDGEITRIVPQADIQRNTLQVKVRINDPAPELRPDMLARVRFADAAAAGAAATNPAGASGDSLQVLAPESALDRGTDGRATAWVVDSDAGVAERRSVTAGDARQDGWVVVREGLRAGDRLIAGDTSKLRDGQRVKVVGEADAPVAEPDAKGGSHGAH
jgi:RND family efflux transporter MFP subunit